MNVVIVGRGRVGRALAAGLRGQAARVSTLGRKWTGSRIAAADLVILAVPDHEIAKTAKAITPSLKPPVVVVHCAGALELGELQAPKKVGASIGVLHPLASCANTRTPTTLAHTTCLVYGDPKAVRQCRRVIRMLDARAVVRQVDGPTYHAAAALVANGSAALAFAGSRILQRLGFSAREADRALGGLLRTVGDNVAHVGTPEALTGPIARGDADTVRMHRRALATFGKTTVLTYDRTATVILECAKAAGLSRANATKIVRALTPPLRRDRSPKRRSHRRPRASRPDHRD